MVAEAKQSKQLCRALSVYDSRFAGSERPCPALPAAEIQSSVEGSGGRIDHCKKSTTTDIRPETCASLIAEPVWRYVARAPI